jgi:hypothetical protein
MVVSAISSLLEALSSLLLVVIIVFLLRGSFRRYPLVLLYCVLQLAATATEEYVWRVLGEPRDTSTLFRTVYWTDEVVLDLVLFLMVIAMTYRALEGSPLRTGLGRLLAAVVAFVLVAPFILFSARRFGTGWYNSTSQLLNFGAAIMNLGLWTALIGTKKRDALLLKVSAGLGIAVTGAAIAYGLRKFTTGGGTERDLANLFKTVTYLASVLIWCWAFRPPAKPSPAPSAAVSP